MKNQCFICFSEADLTMEHVMPNWLQKLSNLHTLSYSPPNGDLKKYKWFKVSLCKSCNQLLSKNLEDEISRAFKKWFDNIFLLDKDILFYWLLKIYYWSLVRDVYLFADPKNQDLWTIIDPIELKKWFCAMQQILKWSINVASLDFPKPYSLFIFQITHWTDEFGQFDYWTLISPFVIFIRYNNFWLICCLQDWWILQNVLWKYDFFKIPRNIHVLQFNEIIAWISYKCSKLETVPSFLHVCKKDSTFPEKIITLPNFSWNINFSEWKHEEFKHYLKHFLSRYPIDLAYMEDIDKSVTFIHKGNDTYFLPEEVHKMVTYS